MSDEVKAIPMEERMAKIKQAIALGWVDPRIAYDWTQLFLAAIDGEPYHPCTNSNFFRHLLSEKRQIVETLGPLIKLTVRQLDYLQARWSAKEGANDSANG